MANKNYQFQIRGLCGTVFSGVVIGTFKTKLNLKDDELQNRITEDADSENNSFGPTTIDLIPNPARDFTTLLIQGFENSSKEVTMLEFNGKLIFKINVDAKENQLELDLKTLSVYTGIYLIRVSDSKKQKTEQLVIER
ncbi:MAG: T9SS type A sorting domain-containing protein [Saprospiraceae bacterium]|nr:T9SS type A sorting domain-containing protein [Saprospiraceae bacterium]